MSRAGSSICSRTGAGHGPPRRLTVTRALRLAQESGYQDMVAYVLIRRSISAVAALDARQAITFANAASRTDGTSAQVRALGALKAAHAHALARDAASCERSLANAYDLLGANTEDAHAGDVIGHEVTAPYVLAADARCWIWLRPSKAIGMFEDALRRWPRDRTRSRGVQQARLAVACAAAQEPERAAAEGMKALDIAQRTRSEITIGELKQLDHQTRRLPRTGSRGLPRGDRHALTLALRRRGPTRPRPSGVGE